jgi:DNA-binding NarL/FixJ family response regulator
MIANAWSAMSSASADLPRVHHRPSVAIGCGRAGCGDPLARLTAREREVLDLLAEGLSNSSIAQQLRTAERTVETHTSRIFAKLDLEATPSTHRRVLATLTQLEAVGRLTAPAPIEQVRTAPDGRLSGPVRATTGG